MERKLRVLVVLFNLAVVNGVSSFVMNYFRKLNHSIVQMDFVVYSKVESPYVNEIQNAGGKIYLIPSIRKISQHIAASKKIIEEGHYDIVHDNILILSYFIMHYAKKYGVPVRIFHSHNSKFGDVKYKEIRNRLFMPLLFSTITDYFSCSELAAQNIFGKRPYTFIPNVISPARFSFNEEKRKKIRRAFAIGNKLVIGSVGRLAEQKNPLYAIDVISELYKINPNIEYWWIGEGYLQPQVENKIHEKGMDGVIKLLGRRTDMADLYQALDIFFLPSLFEGLPVTGVEAQATGLPCLISDTITKQFIYTDLVKTFPIKNSPKRVAEILAQYKRTIHFDRDRSKYVKILESTQFSDKHAGQYLLAVYKKLLDRQYNIK